MAGGHFLLEQWSRLWRFWACRGRGGHEHETFTTAAHGKELKWSEMDEKV